MLLLLPAVTIVFIDFWDYHTTLAGAYYCGAYELNPAARFLIERGDLHSLIYAKGVHTILTLLTYAFGLYFTSRGRQEDHVPTLLAGHILLFIFFLAYVVGLFAITLNVNSLSTILKEACSWR